MTETVRNAAALAVAGGILVLAPQHRWGRWALPVLLLAAMGLALGLRALGSEWALASAGRDAPWPTAALLAAWAALGACGAVRVTGWLPTVLISAVGGSALAVTGVMAGEPDPARRARLVLAASGASVLGVASGAGVIALGHVSPTTAAVGLATACIGASKGGMSLGRGALAPGRAAVAGLVVLAGALTTWLVTLGGGLEFAADGLDWLPQWFPGWHVLMAGGAALLGGALGHGPTLALVAQASLERALAVRGDWAHDALVLGLAVGGGLPALLASGSSLRTGFPLWLCQVAVVGLWLYERG